MKECTACQQKFECKADDIQQCHCYSVTLNKTQLERLKLQFQDCLCNECLQKLASNLLPEASH